MNNRLLTVALWLSLCVAAPLHAAPIEAPKPDTNAETRITADKLTYLAEKQQVVFENKVHVVRPDFELWADKLTVYFKPPNKQQAKPAPKSGTLPEGMATGDVDRIVAERAVRMKRDNRNGSCDKATYTMDNEMLLMEGNPRLSDGDNTITGERIRYFTKENRSEVEGGRNQRVEAVFSSPQKQKPRQPERSTR